MLQTIREQTQGWIAGVIISIIIMTFALWGIHSYFVSNGAPREVATVNGVEITRQQLAGAFERVRKQVQSQQNNTSLVKDETLLKSQALQSLIDIEVLKQASRVQGFRISDNQVNTFLQTIPEFQVKGQFSVERFQQVLTASSMSASQFIDLIKTSLLIDQPKFGLVFSSFSLPDESNSTIALVNQERDIDYITLPLSFMLAQPFVIPASEIKAYYETHQNEFMTPGQVSVDYLEVSLKTLTDTIVPTDDELKNFYKENHYPTQNVNEPQDLSFEAVKDKIKATYIRQHAEEKFTEMREKLADYTYEHSDSLEYAAKTLGLPIKTSQLFTKDEVGTDISKNAKVRQVAFSKDVLNLQNNSDVIQINPETLIVLHLKSYTAAKQLPLANVSKQIESKLQNQKAVILVEKFAKDFQSKLQTGADVKQLATSHHLDWKKVGFVGRYSNQVDSAILDTAFRMPHPDAKHAISYGITKLPNGFAIIAVNAIKDGSIADNKQYEVFAEQVQHSNGLLEYELYKQSQVKQAQINITKLD